MTITDMIERGYRVYRLDTSPYKRRVDLYEKRLGLEIVIWAPVNLIFIKTIYKRYGM